MYILFLPSSQAGEGVPTRGSRSHGNTLRASSDTPGLEAASLPSSLDWTTSDRALTHSHTDRKTRTSGTCK